MEQQLKHHFSDGVYAKQMTLPKGYTATTHAHKYDHLSIMFGGPVIVSCDGVETTYEGAECILIKANVQHSITALGDSHWFCVHKTDETDIEKIDEVLVRKD